VLFTIVNGSFNAMAGNFDMSYSGWLNNSAIFNVQKLVEAAEMQHTLLVCMNYNSS
jgi:hypothetical protein